MEKEKAKIHNKNQELDVEFKTRCLPWSLPEWVSQIEQLNLNNV